MDLIYTNAAMEDVGVLHKYELDLAYGADENDFECRITSNAHCCEAGSLLYIEGTEYGGIVDEIESNTGTKEVVYRGRTWHGIIGSKIILPLKSGEASTGGVTIKTSNSSGVSNIGRYLIISGDANQCIAFLIDRLGLGDMFSASEVYADVQIQEYQFLRYTDGYSGIVKMLESANLKLRMVHQGSKIVLSAVPKTSSAQDSEMDSDLIDFSVTKVSKSCNHLICLGPGTLEKRLTVHLYADTEGNISQTQTQFGIDEYVSVYDYPNVETKEDLINFGTERLTELINQDSVSVNFDETEDPYDVGDVVSAFDNVTGISISVSITKKVVTVKNGRVTIGYGTDSGTVNSSGTGGGGAGNITDHADLKNRDGADQHPIASITGLEDALNKHVKSIRIQNTNKFSIQTRFSSFDGSGSRQSFFLFGYNNMVLVQGVIGVGNNGDVLWSGTNSVTVAAGTGGKITITLPNLSFDTFLVLSPDTFTLSVT